jgi:hypothetical protein
MIYKKILLAFLVSMLLFSVLSGIGFVDQVEAQTIPTVSMMFPNGTNSSYYEYRFNNTFRVNITVDSPDIGIWSWQVGIYYNSSVLECLSLGNGSFFSGKYTLGFQPGTINNDLGYVTICGSSLRLPETEGVLGSGVLMWFEFNVTKFGPSLMNLTLSPPDLSCGTKLNEIVDPDVVPISPIILYDGWINTRRIGDLGGPVDLVPTFFAYDYKVGGYDLALFIHCYKGLAPPEAMYLADLGGGLPPQFFAYDGKVDGLDLALFIACYKGNGPDT